MNMLKFGGDALVHGAGSLEYLDTMPCKSALIVTSGPYARQSGQLSKITDRLEAIGAAWQCFEGIEPNPEFASIYAGAQMALECEPDWIIGLGGGSALDGAKAVWAIYENPELDSLQKLRQPGAIRQLRVKAKLLCVPTTSGTGSEMTRSVVISDVANDVKVPVADLRMIPDVALLCPEMTVSMPASLTANTGLDALTHALEAYVSVRNNDFTDALAEGAVQLILQYLPLTLAEPGNLYYRERMQNAATMAGMAFALVGLGVTHSIAHTFGGVFHVPHGLANAIALPYVLGYNMAGSEDVRKKYAKMERICQVEDIRRTVVELKEKLGVPAAMNQVVPEADYLAKTELLVDSAMLDMCRLTNPVAVEKDQMKQLMDAVYYGK